MPEPSVMRQLVFYALAPYMIPLYVLLIPVQCFVYPMWDPQRWLTELWDVVHEELLG